jgi:hypothetical protein
MTNRHVDEPSTGRSVRSLTPFGAQKQTMKAQAIANQDWRIRLGATAPHRKRRQRAAVAPKALGGFSLHTP